MSITPEAARILIVQGDLLIKEVETIMNCDAPVAPAYPWHPTESDKRPTADAWRLWQNEALKG